MATDRITSTIEWFEPDVVPGNPCRLLLAVENPFGIGEVVPGFYDGISGEFMGGDMLGALRVNALRWAYMPDFPKP